MLCLSAVSLATEAATIWSGPRVNFTKLNGTDASQPENQDRITPNVWITRAATRGLFNAKTETFYSGLSPADTEWAYGTTANFASLTYKPWIEWHERNPPDSVGKDAVLHLKSEDIYIDIKFTFWSVQAGGGFGYTRSTPSGAGPASTTVVEFVNASLNHYFITWVPAEIAILDAGVVIRGWVRTGKTFQTYTTAQNGTSPVCRYYIPPALGDSHFFGRGTAECNATGQNNPSFVLEEANFMHMFLPTAGNCPASTTQVYRVFSNRLDANHRYMTDRAVRDQMVAMGWLAEGDGPDLVVMCAPQ